MPKRTKKGEKKMDRLMNMKLSEEFMEAIDEFAWARRQSRTAVMKMAFVKFFEENEDSIMEESRDRIKKLLKESPEFQRKRRGEK